MKFSVSTYSFGKYCSRGVPYMIDRAAELGFDGIEFCLGDGFSDSELISFGRRVRDAGLDPVCSCVGADFLSCPSGDISTEIEKVKNEVRRAELLGVPLMRHDVSVGAGGKLTDKDYADALSVMAEACREITRFASERGVRTCTENHGYFSQDARRVVSLIEAAGDVNFGALCDIGNFMCADEDPPESVSILAPYAFHVHAKDFCLFRGTEPPGGGYIPTRGGDFLLGTAIGDGDAKAAESLAVLKRAGYDGFVTVEFEGREDAISGISRGLEFLKNTINPATGQ